MILREGNKFVQQGGGQDDVQGRSFRLGDQARAHGNALDVSKVVRGLGGACGLAGWPSFRSTSAARSAQRTPERGESG